MVRELLADCIVVLHLAYAGFIILGIVAIGVGGILSWGWVRRPILRAVHAGAMGIVAVEALIGMTCPLTVWEYALRDGNGEPEAFIPRLASRLLYYQLPPWAFTALYLGLLAGIGALWIVVRPRPFRSRRTPPPS
jgi:Protein of Unknown function (DUF2784)